MNVTERGKVGFHQVIINPLGDGKGIPNRRKITDGNEI